jgi:hypothetical protein
MREAQAKGVNHKGREGSLREVKIFIHREH